MSLIYESELFQLEPGPRNNRIAKRAGFTWNQHTRTWVTPFVQTAARAYRNPDIVDIIEEGKRREQERICKSESLRTAYTPPSPDGMEFLPYQCAGVEYMLGKKRVLLADQMGLGKTIQAIGLCNALAEELFSVLVICPASLKLNWKREFEKWSTTALTVGIGYSSNMPDTDVQIINYDIVAKNLEAINALEWDLLILDEVHYLKNKKAQRTKAVLGYGRKSGIPAKRVVALTGTPILNRPIELYNILHYLDPVAWKDKTAYARRYCDARHTMFGFDESGYSNLDELQQKLRASVMIRRLKKDVLTELPPKIRQVIEIAPKDANTKKALKEERSIFSRMFGVTQDNFLDEIGFREVVNMMQGGVRVGFEEMSLVRRETAEYKIPYVIEHLKECLTSSDKVVCFAHHIVMVHALEEAFPGVSVTLTGKTSATNKDKAVQAFQNDPKIKLFIGNLIAAGTGLTLTAASHVVFAEISWVPGEVTQAEDRCHRIGQNDSVLVQHLVLSGSLDATMSKTIVRKQTMIEQAVDRENTMALIEKEFA